MISKKKVTAIIPARGGSKGIPAKNIKLLNGKPLIAYTIEAAKNSKYIDYLMVSTDDKEIAKVSERYGANVPFLRNEEFSGDDVPVFPDTVVYVADELEKRGIKSDIIIVLLPTSPLRNSDHIDKAIEKLVESKSEWVVSICEMESSPFKSYFIEGGRLTPVIKSESLHAQRQDLPKSIQEEWGDFCNMDTCAQKEGLQKNKRLVLHNHEPRRKC